MAGKPRLGVSRCLLGDCVRYDGGHKLNRFLKEEVGRYVSFVPVCPEVECGLGVPRQPMRLVGDPSAPRLVAIATGIDHTDRLTAWARRRLDELEGEGLCGFVFKSKSPSCGLRNVPVFQDNGEMFSDGQGIFARMFRELFAQISCAEEVELESIGFWERFWA